MKKQNSAHWMLAAAVLLSAGCDGPGRQEPSSPPVVKPAESPITPSDSRQPAADSPPTTPNSPAETRGDQALSLRMNLDAADDHSSLDINKAMDIVLTNTSNRTLRIWRPETESGYRQWSFHFTNLRSHEKHVARRRVIEHEEYWERITDGIEPGSAVIEIPPAETFTIQVPLDVFAWGEKARTGLPGPNSDDRFSVFVQFESAAEADASSSPLWTGKVLSDPVTAAVIASSLKTPHDYLEHGFPQRAIEVMNTDPKWINTEDELQCTPLHHAARYRHLDALQWLLDHGADVNPIAYNGFTPLYFADDPQVMQLLLQKQPDLTIRCDNQTPLQRAAANLVEARQEQEKEKWRKIVTLLEQAGAEYDVLTAIYRDDLKRVQEILKVSPVLADDFQNKSLLREAASVGRLEICRYLIEEHHVDVNDFERGVGYPIIKEALAFPEVVRLLIDKGADLKTRITWRGGRSGIWLIGDDATVLHYAADDGVPETITLLLDRGVDLFATAHSDGDPSPQQTALDVAACFCKAANVQAMVNHPAFAAADPQRRQSQLDRCLLSWHFSMGLEAETPLVKLFKVLLDHGANPNARKEGATAMQIVTSDVLQNSDTDNAEIKQVVALLRERGATVDLFSAVAIGDEEQVQLSLMQDRASANSRRPDGYPALHLAVEMDYRNIVAALLKAGADIEIRNESENFKDKGETTLHCAAIWGRYEAGKLLIDAGANVNALTDHKSTPLHIAARMGHLRLVRLLLEHGANPDARDKDQQTPLDWCRNLKGTKAAETEKVFRDYQAQRQK